MRFIFLSYVSRSGSTMLASELAAHSDEVLVVPESRLLEVLIAEGDEKLKRLDFARLNDLIMLDHQIANLGISMDDLRALCARSVGKGILYIMESISAMMAEMRGIRPKLIVIKLGSLIFLHKQLEKIFPDCGYLHVVRDPRAVVNSMVRSNRPYFPEEKMGRGDALYIAGHWNYFLNVVDKVQALGGRVYTVRYEDLIADLDATLMKLCRNYEVKYSSNKILGLYEVPEIERSIHSLVGNKPVKERSVSWRAELKGWQIAAVELYCSRHMKMYGYEKVRPIQNGRIFFAMLIAVTWYVLHSTDYYWRRIRFYSSKPAWLLNRIKLLVRTK